LKVFKSERCNIEKEQKIKFQIQEKVLYSIDIINRAIVYDAYFDFFSLVHSGYLILFQTKKYLKIVELKKCVIKEFYDFETDIHLILCYLKVT